MPNFDRMPNIIPGATVTLSIHCLERTGLRNITTKWILNTIKDFCKYHLRDIQSLQDESKFLIVGSEADIAIVKQDFGKIENYLVTTVHKTLYKRRDNKLYFMPNAINKQVEGSPTHYRYDYPEGTKVYQKTVHHRPSKVITLKLFNKFYSFTRQDLIDMTQGKKSRKVAAKNFVNEALDEINIETPYFQGRHMSNARPNSIVYVITDKTGKFHIVDGFYTVLKTLGYSLETKKFYPAYKNHDVNVKEIPIDMIKNFDISVNLKETTFKQYLDQLADKLSKPKMIVENPKTMNPIQPNLSIEERIQHFKPVELDEISLHDIPNILREDLHRDIPVVEDLCEFEIACDEDYREALIAETHLFENDEEYIQMRDFLMSIKSEPAIPGHEYVYALFEMTPMLSYKFLAVKYTRLQKLSMIDNSAYYFEYNGKYKPLPSNAALRENYFKKDCLLKNQTEFDDIMTELKLKFDHIWKINAVEIDFNRGIQESTSLILTIGDIAEKHKCSLMMVELALKQGIQQELKRSNDLTHAKRIALKKITHDIDYYKKAKT